MQGLASSSLQSRSQQLCTRFLVPHYKTVPKAAAELNIWHDSTVCCVHTAREQGSSQWPSTAASSQDMTKVRAPWQRNSSEVEAPQATTRVNFCDPHDAHKTKAACSGCFDMRSHNGASPLRLISREQFPKELTLPPRPLPHRGTHARPAVCRFYPSPCRRRPPDSSRVR